jgi:hypothetical protein
MMGLPWPGRFRMLSVRLSEERGGRLDGMPQEEPQVRFRRQRKTRMTMPSQSLALLAVTVAATWAFMPAALRPRV